MAKSIIELKGSTFTLPVIYLYSENIQEIEVSLSQKIKQAPQLLKNASIIINIASVTSTTNIDFKHIAEILKKNNINLVGFSGCSKQQKDVIIKLGFSVLSEGKTTSAESQKTKATQCRTIENNTYFPPLVINSPVRSGQQVYAKDRDLIINTSVSTGAEIISDGNIHIYGVVRGKIIAGANGNESARIYCTQLEAELVSIAGQYWLSDKIPKEYIKKPVNICIHEGTLSIQPLHISI